MQKLTVQGQQIINDLAQRYGISPDAVMTMLQAVLAGNGTMAQFNHPDFGGSGQWMQGGMTMVGDMFNYGLKSKVEGLCAELSNLLASQEPPLFQTGSFQSQSQSGTVMHNQSGVQNTQQSGTESVSLFVKGSDLSGNWWPIELGSPSSTGSQNNLRYAYFPESNRLVVEINGHTTVYDSLNHQIGGVSQQQSTDASLTFTSQFGLVRVDNLPVVSIDGVAPKTAKEMEASGAAKNGIHNDEILAAIEQLAELHDIGILTHEEFSAKKTELLSKL